MLFIVDFSVKEKKNFRTIYSAVVPADNVSECQIEAEKIKETLYEENTDSIYFFIENFEV